MAGTAPQERVLGCVECKPFKTFRIAVLQRLLRHSLRDGGLKSRRDVHRCAQVPMHAGAGSRVNLACKFDRLKAGGHLQILPGWQLALVMAF